MLNIKVTLNNFPYLMYYLRLKEKIKKDIALKKKWITFYRLYNSW